MKTDLDIDTAMTELADHAALLTSCDTQDVEQLARLEGAFGMAAWIRDQPCPEAAKIERLLRIARASQDKRRKRSGP